MAAVAVHCDTVPLSLRLYLVTTYMIVLY